MMSMRNFTLSLVLLSTAGLWQSAHAFNRLTDVTSLEWQSWPRMCQGKSHHGIPIPKGLKAAPKTAEEGALMWAVGGWHYCVGWLKVQRVQTGHPSSIKGDLLRDALKDIEYSYSKIDKKEPWAAEMATTKARALRLGKQHDAALKVLNDIKPLHPTYGPMYLGYSAIYFEQKDYAKAAEILREGNKATGDKIAAIQYFLGLSLFKSGQIDEARIYEAKARENRYPMRFLTRKLAEHDRKLAAAK